MRVYRDKWRDNRSGFESLRSLRRLTFLCFIPLHPQSTTPYAYFGVHACQILIWGL